MNTGIGRIACRQSRLGGFAHFPSPKPAKEFSLDGGDGDDDDASCSETHESSLFVRGKASIGID